MKVLLVNNFYYNRGGDCTYLFSLKRLLEERGHKVIVFSMDHPQNVESEYAQYFVSYINYAEEAKNKSLSSAFRVLFRSIHSTEAKKKIERLINDEKPDIVHLNNIRHHITPSILHPIKKFNIPVVWTLHDYQLICPNISFLARGKICEKCRKRKYFWPALVKCKKDSFLASLMAAVEHSVQMIMKVYDLVDVFICPSEFLRNKFVEYGFDEKRLICLQHFINADWDNKRGSRDAYVLYVGRLSEEKGVKTLIDAVIKADVSKLKIVGEGPLREELVLYARAKNVNNRIEFLGSRDHREVIELLKSCKFLVVPSEWYEVFGLVILEAFACGKTVIGSRIGGIPEIIKDNVTGITFDPGNSEDLSAKIKYLDKNPDKALMMGEAGRMFVKKELSPEKHYQKLMEIYAGVLNTNSVKGE